MRPPHRRAELDVHLDQIELGPSAFTPIGRRELDVPAEIRKARDVRANLSPGHTPRLSPPGTEAQVDVDMSPASAIGATPMPDPVTRLEFARDEVDRALGAGYAA